MKMFLPLFVPMLALVVSLPTAMAIFTRRRGTELSRTWLMWVTVLAAAIAAMVPNSGQRLYDLGVSLRFVDLARNASYFLFFFALTGTWILIGHNWKRWALLVLAPIALLEPLKWTWAYLLWNIRGFAP